MVVLKDQVYLVTTDNYRNHIYADLEESDKNDADVSCSSNMMIWPEIFHSVPSTQTPAIDLNLPVYSLQD